MKRVLLAFVLVFILLLVACSPQEAVKPPSLTEQDVISLVLVHGIPTLTIYGNQGNPVGQWAAVLQRDGHWEIRGAVVFSDETWTRDCYYSTQWKCLIDKQGFTTIKLIDYDGELPALKAKEGEQPTATYKRPQLEIAGERVGGW